MAAPFELVLLVLAAALGGALNSVAGGGSFFTFPALLLTGVPPLSANATSTVALWPGSLASAYGYREDFRSDRRTLVPFAVGSLLGGLAGAFVLINTPEEVFRLLVPWLLLTATLVFAFGGPLVRRLRAPGHATGAHLWGATALMFLIAIYGGYFGGGMGFLILAALTLLGLEDIHQMNGLKALLAVAINGIALVAFVVAGLVDWPIALLMVGGAVAGGYGGAWAAKRVDARKVRGLVIALGAALTAYFFWLTYA
ncbi:MAG TPA: sulfite exporter TauE/SafE family protein [Candidatus Thermoplasmatota archaeon]|nr:sulfite exporter TauE/SafE family protein [Candidatus Thermoplasmatota archaeon]